MAEIKAELFIPFKRCAPLPFGELDKAIANRCIQHTPVLPDNRPADWISPISGGAEDCSTLWKMPIASDAAPLDFALLDDTFAGVDPLYRDTVIQASLDAGLMLCGAFAIPSIDDPNRFIFINTRNAPLAWCILILLIDRGATTRTHCAVRRGLPASVAVAARAILKRAECLLERASAVYQDAQRMEDVVPGTFFVMSALYPILRQSVRLTKAATIALGSVLLASRLWTENTIERAPLAIVSALRALPRCMLETIYTPAQARSITAYIDRQQRFEVGPEREVMPLGQAFQMPSKQVLTYIAGKMLALLGKMDFCSACVLRALLWADPGAMRQLKYLPTREWAEAAWRIAAITDSLMPIFVMPGRDYPVPTAFLTELPLMLRTLQAGYGGAIPTSLLLSCSPVSSSMLVTSHTLIPPVSASEIWRRVYPIRAEQDYPMVLAFVDGHGADWKAQPLPVQHQYVHAQMLAAGRQHNPASVILYSVGSHRMTEFASFVAAVRIYGAQCGDRVWNVPANSLPTESSLFMDAECARVFMLRSLMLRLYANPSSIFFVPFASMIIARELFTMETMTQTNPGLQTDLAGAVCDFVVSMLRLSLPTAAMNAAGVVMTQAELKIVPAHRPDSPWAVTACLDFLGPFLCRVAQRIGRTTLVESKVLYDGYHNTILSMMRSPRDSITNNWQWPKPVMDILLRYFFLVHCSLIGILPDPVRMHTIIELNDVLVQTLAFIYIFSVVDSDELDRIFGLDGSGVHQPQYFFEKEKKPRRRRSNSAEQQNQPSHAERGSMRLDIIGACEEFIVEKAVLRAFPLQSASIHDELASLTGSWNSGSTAPVYTPIDYATLQLRRGTPKSARAIYNAAIMIFDQNRKQRDLARAIIAVSAEKGRRQSYRNSLAAIPNGIDYGDDSDDYDGDENSDGYFHDRSDAVNHALQQPAWKPLSHKVISPGQSRSKRRRGSRQDRLAARVDSAAALAAADTTIYTDASPYMLNQAGETLPAASRSVRSDASGHNSSGDDDDDDGVDDELEDEHELYNKHRRKKYNLIRSAGASLSRFMVLAITMTVADNSTAATLPDSFIRATMCTLRQTCDNAAHPPSWNHSPLDRYNQPDSVKRGIEALREGAQLKPMPGIYHAFKMSASTGWMSKDALTWGIVALCRMEMARFVSRTHLETAHMIPVINSVFDANKILDLCNWNLPTVSATSRTRGNQIPLIYPYSCREGISSNRVAGVSNPRTHLTADDEPVMDRQRHDRDAPYDFSHAIWMWRVMATAPANLDPIPGIGAEALAACVPYLHNVSIEPST